MLLLEELSCGRRVAHGRWEPASKCCEALSGLHELGAFHPLYSFGEAQQLLSKLLLALCIALCDLGGLKILLRGKFGRLVHLLMLLGKRAGRGHDTLTEVIGGRRLSNASEILLLLLA